MKSFEGVLTKVYKYNSDTGLYEYFVSLPNTNRVVGMKAFDINGRMFLFVANQLEGSSSTTTSRLFVINDDTGDFEVHQLFMTYEPIDVSYLRANNGNRYLLITNYKNFNVYEIDSVVYQWNNTEKQFSQIGLLRNKGAFYSTLFEIDGQIFAGIANHYDTSDQYNVLDVIFKMNTKGSWSVHQKLPESGNGGISIKSFQTDTGLYLVSIQYKNCIQNSIVYRWNPVTEEFEIHQKIPMVDCPVNSEIFKVGGEVFMITSNTMDKWGTGVQYNVVNVIYKLEGSIFVKYLTVPGREVWNWSSFERNGELYLAQANSRHETNDDTVGTSLKIFQWK
ncbi:thrombospondin-type laminin G domain and EAR repeat-containing protein-like [Anneissia japonica]|uniref:thrombospondin-type laminin G domain and EAR repeat-containing protein-like n=1 Tax=Anneissia japonica TaxID=1529436 RepID=UPI0014259A81|nr:thrombospondin-type laminin G domain and EAR repeat-containing protein-like [Anneissia japonica]